MTATVNRDYLTNPPVEPTRADGQRFSISLTRYHEWIKSGALTEQDKVELIFGQLIPKIPIGERHEECVDILNEYLVVTFRKSHIVRTQNSIQMPDHSEPEPDLALINKSSYSRGQGKPRPENVDLVVEVADSTLAYDRRTKSVLYALAGIQEYWIINLRDDQVEVRTNPDTELGEYGLFKRYTRSEVIISPFARAVAVADLLPPTA